MSQPIIVNGIVWQNASFVLSPFGLLNYVTELNYEDDTVTTMNYGPGNQPILLGTGNESYKGSITMYQEGWGQILTAFPNIIASLGFELAVTFVPTAKSPILTPYTDTLYNVVFNKTGLTTKQGDTHIMITIPFIYAGTSQFS